MKFTIRMRADRMRRKLTKKLGGERNALVPVFNDEDYDAVEVLSRLLGRKRVIALVVPLTHNRLMHARRVCDTALDCRRIVAAPTLPCADVYNLFKHQKVPMDGNTLAMAEEMMGELMVSTVRNSLSDAKLLRPGEILRMAGGRRKARSLSAALAREAGVNAVV